MKVAIEAKKTIPTGRYESTSESVLVEIEMPEGILPEEVTLYKSLHEYDLYVGLVNSLYIKGAMDQQRYMTELSYYRENILTQLKPLATSLYLKKVPVLERLKATGIGFQGMKLLAGILKEIDDIVELKK